MQFTLHATDGNARQATIQLGSKTVQTPFFMPVATKATVKHFTFDQLKQLPTQAVIMNAFILSLKPGAQHIAQRGGLHQFSTWDRLIATDSGGFQVLSEQFVDDKNDRGVYFKNPYDGTVSLFRPEDAVAVQNYLGSDIAMVLDDQPPFTKDEAVIQEAVDRTLLWAKRSIDTHRQAQQKGTLINKDQMIFAIGQGGIYNDIRASCAQQLIELNPDGFAVGGLAIGEPPASMYEAIASQTSVFPKDKPRYVMGLGSPVDMVEAIERGADMFDSIFPTQSARRGTLFTTQGLVRITNKQYREDDTPIDPLHKELGVTKAYIHHLLRVDEASGMQYATQQNLWFMAWMMQQIRTAIVEGKFADIKMKIQDLWS